MLILFLLCWVQMVPRHHHRHPPTPAEVSKFVSPLPLPVQTSEYPEVFQNVYAIRSFRRKELDDPLKLRSALRKPTVQPVIPGLEHPRVTFWSELEVKNIDTGGVRVKCLSGIGAERLQQQRPQVKRHKSDLTPGHKENYLKHSRPQRVRPSKSFSHPSRQDVHHHQQQHLNKLPQHHHWQVPSFKPSSRPDHQHHHHHYLHHHHHHHHQKTEEPSVESVRIRTSKEKRTVMVTVVMVVAFVAFAVGGVLMGIYFAPEIQALWRRDPHVVIPVSLHGDDGGGGGESVARWQS
ncbi:unnamed protein product [Notodromas monacha]|uniref:Uncharacterized protein n=1 Tax=Notodromas monacha TaxID=399045 RepID=A0A7R9BHX8_9CRUS|nr:unnamed protein product [Notodromas monacha]CAG0914419.1 unnamed protein product [Notodromas monacha]